MLLYGVTQESSHLRRFSVLGDEKGLLNAAMRTSCLLDPLLFTALMADSLGSGPPADRGACLAAECLEGVA